MQQGSPQQASRFHDFNVYIVESPERYFYHHSFCYPFLLVHPFMISVHTFCGSATFQWILSFIKRRRLLL